MHIEKLRKILEMLDKMNLAELELETEDLKLKIKKHMDLPSMQLPSPASLSSQMPPAIQPVLSPGEQARLPLKVEPQVERTKIVSRDKVVSVKSPIVGSFYRSPSPDAEPYVKVGDLVSKGQVLCIVEAMKIMNEIESEYEGRIVEILVENEQPVEYGQELFLIELK